MNQKRLPCFNYTTNFDSCQLAPKCGSSVNVLHNWSVNEELKHRPNYEKYYLSRTVPVGTAGYEIEINSMINQCRDNLQRRNLGRLIKHVIYRFQIDSFRNLVPTVQFCAVLNEYVVCTMLGVSWNLDEPCKNYALIIIILQSTPFILQLLVGI